MAVARGRLARGRAPAPARARRADRGPRRMNDAELRGALREHALPRGRLPAPLGHAAPATTSTSTASRRGPTCSGRSASALAAAVAEHEPGRRAARRARSSAPCALAAAASLESGLPFLIVRERGEGATAPPTASRASSSRASASASSRTSSPPAARPSRPSRRSARPASSVRRGLRGRPRGGRRRRARRAMRCGSGRFSGPQRCWKPQNRRKTAWLSRFVRSIARLTPRTPSERRMEGCS